MTLKHIFLTLFSLFLIGLAIVAALSGYAVKTYYAPGPLQEETFIVIERGTGVSAIAAQLEQAQVIDSALLFKIAARIKGTHQDLKAGEYAFPAAVPMAGVMEAMRQGDVYDRKFTIIEGLTSYQIVKRLNAVADLEGDDIRTIPAEGALLPETYHYVRGDTKAEKLQDMQTAMTQTLDELWPQRVSGLPFSTKEDALTLASIVEKETGVPEERKRVAGVFINRLKRGIPLQTDPTVIYALTKGKVKEDGKGPLGRRLLSKDLQVDSPYNTYKNAGLPPGPIANPGRASIEAVLNPETHDFIYFVADGTGGHIFAKTLAEHNRNVANWRKIRRQTQ